MAEYLRFQLNTPPHVSLTSLVGNVGAYCMKARFQQKAKKSKTLLALVDQRTHRGSYDNDTLEINEVLENVNYLFSIGAHCTVEELPDHSILSRPKNRSSVLSGQLSPKNVAYLHELPRNSAVMILRLRCKMFKVKANLPVENCKCSTCATLEDERHVFEDCPKYAHLREPYSSEDISFERIFSGDPTELMKIAEYAEKIENAMSVTDEP